MDGAAVVQCRSQLLQQLQALAQRASGDERMPLTDLADQLSALAAAMRHAGHASHDAAGTLGAAAAPAEQPAGDQRHDAVGPGPATAGSGAGAAAAGRSNGHPGCGAPNGGADAAAAGPAAAAAAAEAAACAAVGPPAEAEPAGQPAKKARKAAREFDFSRYRTRYVALELMYVGWGFQGFARQDSTDNTIEGVFFSALRKVRLIPEASAVPISELQYSRCGRTDRGVSALGQVVALRLRSCARPDEPEPAPGAEYDYPRLINKALPPEVRVLGWAPAPPEFNARFSALYREYKYFIVQQRLRPPTATEPTAAELAPAATQAATAAAAAPAAPPTAHTASTAAEGNELGSVAPACASASAQAPASSAAPSSSSPCPSSSAPSPSAPSAAAPSPPEYSLDIDAMRAAAAHFVGEHDFRNFCKPDVAAVRSFRRRIVSFTIDPVPTCCGAAGEHRVYALTVRGSAFLWHQVRCMAAVLLLVGRRCESPDVVARLLDIQATPCKPQYSMAPEEPLLLYACGYPGLSFRRTPPALGGVLADVGGLLHRHLIGAALTGACHARLTGDERCTDGEAPQAAGEAAAAAPSGRGAGGGGGNGGGMASSHIPLLRRQTEPSIEERMARRGIPWPPPAQAGADGAGSLGGDEDDAMAE